MTSPYEGLRVLDLSDRLSGAFAARLFGDFGADVILAEPPGGHPLRCEPPFLDNKPGLERSTLHAYVNWNKSSVEFTDKNELLELVSRADILITTADPLEDAVFADSLKEMKGHAVHLSITAHGLKDPLSGRPGNNLTASARTGWSFINRYSGEAPLQMPREQTGYVGGVAGYIAAAAALGRRNYNDLIEVVDVSELEAFALTVHPWGIAAIYADMGFSNGPTGGRPRGRPGPLWDLADGRMNFGIADFRNWPEAMRALGLPELAKVEALIPDLGRHSQDLREVAAGMEHSLKLLKRWDVFHEMSRLRCLIGVMQDVNDLGKNEQYAARQFLTETRIVDRTVRAAGAPAKLTPSPWRVARSAPRFNEDANKAKFKTHGSKQFTLSSDGLSADAPAEGPLVGVRVLSFGQAWSGTFGTELLSLLGADVVQLGTLHRPDVWRRTASKVPAGIADVTRTQHALNTQGLYNSVNLNKRELTLDLRQARGMEILWQLLPRFDILIDNFRPTVLPSWGINLKKLHEMRPGMIWASISGYGESGPYREYPANGATTEPMAGLSSLHGYEGNPGMNTGGLYPDPIAGYFLVATIMAALNHRDKTGEPQRVDLSMMEAISVVCGDAIVEYDATGHMPKPRGNHHPRIAPHNNYQTLDDEWLAIATEDETAWRALVSHIGDQRLSGHQFESMFLRKENEQMLDEIVGEWCSTQNAKKAEMRLGSLGITAARVVPLYELYSKPCASFAESGFVSLVDHPEAGKTWLPGRPWRFSGAANAAVRASPCVGQHSREVLAEELGIDEIEYESLVKAGVTGTLDDLKINEPEMNLKRMTEE
jgi:crotonobetainyl-CoA:carnitine CoA-transferase CaiB-like acyl-CoA transferase